MPEIVILIGIQASGKTSFFEQRFAATHQRISLDVLKTRDRERIAIAECLAAARPIVIDNTNVFSSERAPYIALAKQRGFRTIGYFFKTDMRAAIARNSKRDTGKVPVPAILRSHKRLEPPSLQEGFDEIHTVTLTPENRFIVDA